jgi:hypothetical protein
MSLFCCPLCLSHFHWGGVKDGLDTNEISYFAGMSEEKIFEMLLIELPGYKLCIVYL